MQKVTILFFADSHLGFDYPLRSGIHAKRRGADFFRNYHLILEHAKEVPVDLVIHGGDLFYRSKVPPKIVHLAYDALFEFADAGIPIVIVPGNHDRSKLPASLFLQHSNIHIFRAPEIFQFDLQGTPFNICGFPFVRYIGDDIQGIKHDIECVLPSRGINLLCMHQAVEGATVGPSDYTFKRGREVIGLDQLVGPYAAYLSGHIHRYQILSTPPKREDDRQVPFIYPGSIERTSFAERLEEKGYVLLEFSANEALQVTFKKLPSRSMHVIPIADRHWQPSQLSDLIASDVSRLAQNAVVRFDSPTEKISTLLGQGLLRKLAPPEMIFQVRHKWLPRSSAFAKR